MTENELRLFLEKKLGAPVVLKATDNRYSMVTCKRNRGSGSYNIRVHKMFLEAPPEVLTGLALFFKKGGSSGRKIINRFIDENFHLVRSREKKKPAVKKRVTRGKVHDLERFFVKLNKKYFSGKCVCAYTWGREKKVRRGQKSIFLGNYDYETNTIRIHPVLDQKFVPGYVVESVLYHEMLHWYIPPKKKGKKTFYHSRLFRQAEKAHPLYGKTEAWKRKNLARLLR